MPKKHRKERVMFLETQMHEKLSEPNVQIDFMKAFLKNYTKVELIAHEVHSRSSLKKFMDIARKDSRVKIIHFSAHGNICGSKCNMILTGDENVDLSKSENISLFRDLKNMVIFFSCCQIGDDKEIMKKILKRSKAKAIFSYSDDVYNEQAFVIESLFYHLVYGRKKGSRSTNVNFNSIYKRLLFAIDYLGIDYEGDEPLGDPIFVMSS